MAKRFCDSQKFRKTWFRKLSVKMKCVWDFLCSECDHAGIWEVDLDSMLFHIGEKITKSEIIQAFGHRVEFINESKLWIKSFTEFQYGHLNPENRVHQSVINRFLMLGIKLKKKGLKRPLQGCKDKDKDKDKYKDKDKEKERFSQVNAICQDYPRKQGKTPGIRMAMRVIKTDKELEDFKKAIENYCQRCKARGTEHDYILKLANFVKEFEDWITMPEEPGTKPIQDIIADRKAEDRKFGL